MKKIALIAIAGAAVIAGAALVAIRERAGNRRFNVLLITLDTTRADHLGCYGYGQGETKALDGLAKRGVVFEQAFCSVPLTLPSHSTMMTGLAPPEHGLRINGTKTLDPKIPTLAEILRGKGYRTGAFIAAFALDSKFGLDRGFDTYDDDLTGAYEQEVKEPISVYRGANLVADSALRWLEQQGDEPFLCWVHFYDPHRPYHEHPEMTGSRFQGLPGYDAEIAFVDWHVGRLLGFLDKRDLRRRTLVVVVGDHGEGLGQHDEQEHGYMVYNSTMQVPMIFSAPGSIPEGRRVGSIVSLLDLKNTILDCLGVPPSEEGGGRSLKAALHGEEIESQNVYGETDMPYAYFGWGPQRCLTTPEWKYVRSPRAELYNRREDPEELENVIAGHAEKAAELEEELSAIEAGMEVHVAQDVQLDAREKQQLESLGYLGGGQDGDKVKGSLSSLRDVKDMLPVVDMSWQSRKLMQQGQYREAVALCQQMVAMSPESPRLQCYLGDALRKIGKITEAIDHYRHALKTSRDYKEAYHGLGLAYGEMGQAAEAAAQFREVLRIDPDFSPAHKNLGIGLAREGRFAEAAEHFAAMIRIRPDDSNAHYNLGLALASQGKYAEAIGHYTEALRLEPNSELAHNNLGLALAKEGKVKEAIEHYRAALRIEPGHLTAMNNLAWILATYPEEAIRNGEEAVRLAEQTNQASGDKDPTVLDVLAAAYAEAGNMEKATATAERALELAGKNSDEVLAKAIRGRLESYKAGRPCREDPRKPGPSQ